MWKKRWNYLTMPSKTLRRWECALLVLAAALTLFCSWLGGYRECLSGKLLRLHVVANSDSDRDQALKLQVRDKVLAFTERTMRASADRAAANAALQTYLPVIERMAEETLRENGCWDSVEVRLEPTEFPLKAYNGFRLPAGEYMALRVLIGEAAGQNWWCVVYPPLCMTAAADVQETGIACGMEQEELKLMQEAGEEYQIRFRCVELWEQLRQWLHK